MRGDGASFRESSPGAEYDEQSHGVKRKVELSWVGQNRAIVVNYFVEGNHYQSPCSL